MCLLIAEMQFLEIAFFQIKKKQWMLKTTLEVSISNYFKILIEGDML